MKTILTQLSLLFTTSIPLMAQHAASIDMPNLYKGQDQNVIIDTVPPEPGDIKITDTIALQRYDTVVVESSLRHSQTPNNRRSEFSGICPICTPYPSFKATFGDDYINDPLLPKESMVLDRPAPQFYLGTGFSSVLDTYLSPYRYPGTSFDFLYIRQTHKRLFGYSVNFDLQVMSNVSFGYLQRDTRATVTDEYSAYFSRQWNFFPHKLQFPLPYNFRALVGPGINAQIGAIYNTRNGNNPAQAKASVMATVTGQLFSPAFGIRNHYLDFSYQVTMPLIGAAFSPEYGQLYYELFSLRQFGNNNIIFAHPGNTLASQHLILGHLHYRIWALHFGLKLDFTDTRYNHLLYSRKNASFMIGWQYYFYKKL